MRTFSIWNNKDKGKAFLDAMVARGYEYHPNSSDVNVLLIDMEYERRFAKLDQADRYRAKIFHYPHAARTCWVWDGVYKPWPTVLASFVWGEGQKEVMYKYDYPMSVEPIGWTYCPVREFKPTFGNKVTFAPIHPDPVKSGKGLKPHIPPEYIELNIRVFEMLLKLIPDIQLKVRFGRNVAENGLWVDHRVTYELAQYNILDSLKTIMSSDVVIGHDTFGYLAAASGIPTVMFGEELPPSNIIRYVQSWDKYRDLLKFPFNITEARDPGAMISEARYKWPDVETWKKRFIGENFNPDKFVDKIERYMGLTESSKLV